MNGTEDETPVNPELDAIDQREWDRVEKIIQSHAVQLAEHFDTVQIVCTYHSPQMGTRKHCAGSGNAFARIESTADWVNQSRQLREL